MIVCIAEKPSVARDIASILGATSRRDGYIEGNGYQVTWTFGHLCTLKEPHDYLANWKSWSLSSLPMIPERFGIKLIDSESYQKQFHIVEKLMQGADEIINCGDAGQEGELIQRWVMLKAGVKCPVKRLWISSLTEEAIKEGFDNLVDQEKYQSLYEAGLSRAIGDWILGMNATRLYTIKYGQQQQVLSIGRVQTPTLALIVNRHLEIENFVPVPYWELKTVYRDTTFSATKGKFDTKEEGEAFLEQVKDSPFEVTKVTAKKGTEHAPKLFDLTSLQVECNKKFSYSAEETLRLIQSLYEKKLTTYPRVDTTFLSEDVYGRCGKIIGGLSDYETLIGALRGKKLPKSKRYFDSKKVTDHHAIIPTGMRPQGLTDMERNVYDLVVRRFIAIFYPDCKVSTTTVEGKVEKVPFKTSGKQILEPGWRVIFAQSATESTLPAFEKGESGPHKSDFQEKSTLPPKPYTEATLLRAMETAGKLVEDDELRDALKENGIGRPSTRANIIETLLKRRYIRKERKNLVATPTGIELVSLIREELLKSAELTGIWERKLREIEKKEYSAKQFIDELKEMMQQIVLAVLSDNSNRHVPLVDVEEEKKKAAAKRKAENAKKRKENAAKKKAEETSMPAEEKPVETQAAPQRITIGAPCPKCGKGTIMKGRTCYGCSDYKNCDWRAPFETDK